MPQVHCEKVLPFPNLASFPLFFPEHCYLPGLESQEQSVRTVYKSLQNPGNHWEFLRSPVTCTVVSCQLWLWHYTRKTRLYQMLCPKKRFIPLRCTLPLQCFLAKGDMLFDVLGSWPDLFYSDSSEYKITSLSRLRNARGGQTASFSPIKMIPSVLTLAAHIVKNDTKAQCKT